MVEGKKYIVLAPEVYEMLLTKAETPVSLIASTLKQTQENLNTVWNRVGISEEENVRLRTEKLNKLRRMKDARDATAHLVQNALIDKVKEVKNEF